MTHLANKYEIFTPIISSLSQVASNANPNAIAKILDLLRDLQTQIEYTKGQDEALETERRTLWAQELTDLTNQRNHLTDRKHTLTSNIENYNRIIEENIEKTEFHAGEFARYTVLYDNTKVMCDGEQASYDSDTAER